MPDWTYAPVLRPALRRLGPDRGPRLAVAAMEAISGAPGGPFLVRLMAWSYPLPDVHVAVLGRQLASPVGVTAGLDRTGRAARALEALGAGFVEIGPVATLDGLVLPRLRGLLLMRPAAGFDPGPGGLPARIDGVVVEADRIGEALGWGRPVLAAAEHAEDALHAMRSGAAGVVVPSAVLPDLPPGVLTLVTGEAGAPEDAVRLLDQGAVLVGLDERALRAGGPGLPQRCSEAVAAQVRPRSSSAVRVRRPVAAWVSGLLIGTALLATGVGAAAISFGPVLLSYDRAFLGGGTEILDVGRLLPFVQHDRITFAGVAASIGILYGALAWWGMRLGARWARATLAASCAVGMSTLLLFLGFGYFEPLHAAVTAALLPLLLVAVLRPLPGSAPLVAVEPPDSVRRQALTGQLLLVVLAAGLIGGGAVISAVGVGGVFVSTDLAYLGVTPQDLDRISDRIVPFVAHDRAGFGGALVAQGLALLGTSLWGIRAGQRWLWRALLAAGIAGLVPTVAIHVAVGYTDLLHLAPVYFAGALALAALVLTRPYMHAPLQRDKHPLRTEAAPVP